MVAASKMRRAQEQVLATRPYTEKAWQVLSNLAAQRGVDEKVHPLLQVREEVRTVGMLLITADKGLCGSYNHSMVQAASRFIDELPFPVELITVGKRGRDAMWRMNRNIVAEFSDLPPQPGLLDVTPIAHVAMDGFITEQYDVVYLAHTDFINTLTQRPAIWQLLPLLPLDLGVTPVSEHRGEEPPSATVEYIYEPDPAILRAGLVTVVGEQLNAAQLDPEIAYLTGDMLIETPFARVWEVEDWLPFQLKRLRATLRERNVGRATVKKRGSPLVPEELIRDLRLEGEEEKVLFLTQMQGKPIVVIAKEV